MTSLRPYQQQAIQDLRATLLRGNRAPLFVLPTGGGKTAVAAELVRAARSKARRVLFLAPRRELIYQASDRLSVSGVYHGLIMAGENISTMPEVQVASVPTLHVRCMQRELMHLPGADLVIVDEAHIGIGGAAQKILDTYRAQGAIVVGLTATPARTDGRALGMVYDDMILGPSINELIEQGFLVRPRYFVGAAPDMSGVKVQAGDYQAKESERRANDVTLVGDVVENWLRLAGGRQTFVFAAGVAHSRHLCDKFRSYGIAAEHIDGETDVEERKAIQQRLREGKTQVITNCEVMTYGVDFPPVSCIVLAKPTKSVPRYLQMVGRGLRTHEGKADCFVLDHANCVADVGFADDDQPWSLDGKTTLQERKQRDKKEPRDITCPSCENVFRAQKHCPECGTQMHSEYKRAMEELESELIEMERNGKKKKNREMSIEEKSAFFGELKAIASSRGYKPGWAAMKYREKLGVWPNAVDDAPAKDPSPETVAWVKSRQIAWAKRKAS